ncbi:hypothetical protein FSP39_000413 [Pinctada imbricata]|uniref:DNA repair protein RAD51 homolog 3 n=1 Tax=Pinctada imbricata TaxID=66713 RepID=A0AA88XIS2_PINIB|nr:hypothetical protein FSP39_000413 [Pinctada imbricata]
MEDSLEILKLVSGVDQGEDKCRISAPKAVLALDMLYKEQSLPGIVTFSEKIDSMLGGGIPLCKITEFCGAPGIGKTQMCMQLAVDAQIPECFGGVAGEVIYIDTEGSFIVERLEDIAVATVQHCKEMADMEEENEELSAFTTENVLSHIHYYRCQDYIELLATINLIPDFIKKRPKVKLIIVDSIAFHFRHDFDDLSLRTRILTMMAQSFIRLATEHKLAVVLTNQMTTRFAHGEESRLVPALGESWGHASTIRVILYWEKEQRYAWLYKSPNKQETTVPYQVTVRSKYVMYKSPNKQETTVPYQVTVRSKYMYVMYTCKSPNNQETTVLYHVIVMSKYVTCKSPNKQETTVPYHVLVMSKYVMYKSPNKQKTTVPYQVTVMSKYVMYKSPNKQETTVPYHVLVMSKFVMYKSPNK